MIKQSKLFIFTLIISFMFLSFGVNATQTKTNVLVLGTIHRMHKNNQNYSYEDIVRVISTFNPDVICVEIRPIDFRISSDYPKEMILGTVYALKHNKKAYPIDWWNSDDRKLREKLIKEPEYIEKQKLEDSLMLKNEKIQTFYTKYNNIWENAAKFKHEFWNEDEYNSVVREEYKISMQVFGDSPFNLHYKTRNENMLKLIENAIKENRNKKIIVLTGAEHKHFFDDSLSKRNDINLIKFNSILPLKDIKIDTEISELLSTDEDRLYYYKTSQGIDGFYNKALRPLLHGPNMDFNPNIISDENINEAKVFLDKWQIENPKSIKLEFELGWYKFLKSSYKDAIKHYKTVVNNLDNLAISDDFIKAFIYRNLGFCYDMIGEREKAIQNYKIGEKIIETTTFSLEKPIIYRDLKIKPYQK